MCIFLFHRRLIYHGKINMQTRGLVVLLLSKAAGHTSTCSDVNTVGASGVTSRQQTLAEITEMIHTAHLIHKGILNLSSSSIPDENDLHDLQFGNKISILSGDYLLANACKGLANLRNCKVMSLCHPILIFIQIGNRHQNLCFIKILQIILT